MRTIKCEIAQPSALLADFVESFWMLQNLSDREHHIVVVPDGRVDIIFSLAPTETFQATLKGLDTELDRAVIAANTVFFAISFKLLGVEYLLRELVGNIRNRGMVLPSAFWGITPADLTDFDLFCTKASCHMLTLVKPTIDDRKRELFKLIYQANGTAKVQDLGLG